MPVTLIALVGPEGRAETMAVAVLRVRNWLGGFLAELEVAIAADRRMPEALRVFDVGVETGESLARGIVGVAEGYAALERGNLAVKIRDRVSGRSVDRYLESVSQAVRPEALVDVVRASGASTAAIARGGFAVVEAIRSVQDVQDRIGTRGLLDGRLGTLEGRFEVLEGRAVNRIAFDSLATQVAATDARSRALDGRIGNLEVTETPTRGEISALETRLTARFRDDLSVAVGDARTDLGAMRTELGTVRTDLTARIDTKADVRTVAADVGGLRQSVDALRTENRQLGTRIEGVDTRLSTRIVDTDTRVAGAGTIRPRRPGG